MFLSGAEMHLHEGMQECLRWRQNLPSRYPCPVEMPAETMILMEYLQNKLGKTGGLISEETQRSHDDSHKTNRNAARAKAGLPPQ